MSQKSHQLTQPVDDTWRVTCTECGMPFDLRSEKDRALLGVLVCPGRGYKPEYITVTTVGGAKFRVQVK